MSCSEFRDAPTETETEAEAKEKDPVGGKESALGDEGEVVDVPAGGEKEATEKRGNDVAIIPETVAGSETGSRHVKCPAKIRDFV